MLRPTQPNYPSSIRQVNPHAQQERQLGPGHSSCWRPRPESAVFLPRQRFAVPGLLARQEHHLLTPGVIYDPMPEPIRLDNTHSMPKHMVLVPADAYPGCTAVQRDFILRRKFFGGRSGGIFSHCSHPNHCKCKAGKTKLYNNFTLLSLGGTFQDARETNWQALLNQLAAEEKDKREFMHAVDRDDPGIDESSLRDFKLYYFRRKQEERRQLQRSEFESNVSDSVASSEIESVPSFVSDYNERAESAELPTVLVDAEETMNSATGGRALSTAAILEAKEFRRKKDEEREDVLGIQSAPYRDPQYFYPAAEQSQSSSSEDLSRMELPALDYSISNPLVFVPAAAFSRFVPELSNSDEENSASLTALEEGISEETKTNDVPSVASSNNVVILDKPDTNQNPASSTSSLPEPRAGPSSGVRSAFVEPASASASASASSRNKKKKKKKNGRGVSNPPQPTTSTAYHRPTENFRRDSSLQGQARVNQGSNENTFRGSRSDSQRNITNVPPPSHARSRERQQVYLNSNLHKTPTPYPVNGLRLTNGRNSTQSVSENRAGPSTSRTRIMPPPSPPVETRPIVTKAGPSRAPISNTRDNGPRGSYRTIRPTKSYEQHPRISFPTVAEEELETVQAPTAEDRVKLIRKKRDEERENILGIQSDDPYKDPHYMYDDVLNNMENTDPFAQFRAPFVESAPASTFSFNPAAADVPIPISPPSNIKPEAVEEARRARQRKDEEREDLLGIQSMPYRDREYAYEY